MKNHSKNGFQKYDMIVFCHLRWDFVYQRPQHIISRLAKDYKILVVEEPLKRNEEKSVFSVRRLNSQIDVCQPAVDHIDEIGPYLKKHLKQTDFALGWFYSAAFVPVLETLDFESVVYDCMDELSLFKGASSKLLEQEQQLLAAADVVYTGGKSLYESKKQKHHNVFCFPSSVDISHFSSRNNPKPADLEGIAAPIIGYYGVIDERIDLDLIRETAAKSPDASFVMIGPLCKIEESDLPRAQNIYYLGMKSYDELPSYLQYFDVAMMPFALNDSTKFISPTKTLEYMAAEKPIISTKIKDVARDYSNCVTLINDSDDFITAIKNPKQNFRREYREILQKTSWDSTAENMRLMIKRAIA
ncbi:Glycosyltransferase involved in cell wall bisynthesis [Kaistella treverensis]|uniref:Glycosyltransferase involved in cell wall bisynthesis n=1 Tax=Kaistella treverensis TaxID=631455 RepID=A0A1I3K7T9_9FLAO|nr:glycosyltransferase [Kaistella treverensis]SFI68245.1 Glycosyltransferase involved in cell wall bisynthesis [Kaistella treverensis]